MEKEITQIRTWTLDKSHSEIHFRIRHMMISWVSGFFTDFDGHFASSEENVDQISAELSIRVDSISTGNTNRDDHLRSIDFFDAGQFPEIRFESGLLSINEAGKQILSGKINIHGVSRLVHLDVEFSGIARDPWGNEKAGFTITGQINRRDFDISWNTSLETGGVLIGEEVQLRAELQLIKDKDSN
jgi:polyisoprenoid-binding protein YceI